MPLLMKDGRAVLFAHVPKTGGTSVERHFVNNGWEMHWRDGKAGEGSVNSYLQCSPQHIEAKRLGQFFRLDRFDVIISIVRDPIARFRSEYCMRNARDLHVDADTVDSWSQDAFAQYEKDHFVYDNHLRPQHEFIVPEAVVYRLEPGLDRMVEDLNSRFDLGLEGEIPRISDREIENGVPSNTVQIGPRLEQRLRDFYERDYEDFGY